MKEIVLPEYLQELKNNVVESGFAGVRQVKELLHDDPDNPNLIMLRKYQKAHAWEVQIDALNEKLSSDEYTPSKMTRMRRSLLTLENKLKDWNNFLASQL